VKAKLFVFVIMCMCNFACKGCPRNDLYCVGRDVKPYSLNTVDSLSDMFAAYNAI